MKKNSVSDCFKALRERSECALIPFITAGDPDLETTALALKILDENGADLIELGVPYSDPLADGPVIQAAATRALQNNVKLENVLALTKTVGSQIKAPIILFTYYNPIHKRGVESFLTEIVEAGVQGLVVPDLPLEESENLIQAALKKGIEVIMLVAPTSPPERIKAIAHNSQGFIYLVSVTGVTGVRASIGNNVEDLISKLKNVTTKPVGVGFGIKDPQQAQQVKQWGADAVIVGSAFVKLLAEEKSPELRVQAVGEFCRSLKEAIKA